MNEIKLAKGEEAIKTWNYCMEKEGLFGTNKTESSLTLTNKRLVQKSESKRLLTVNEVKIDDIKSINGRYYKRRSFLKLLIDIILCCWLIGFYLIYKWVKEPMLVFELEVTTRGCEGTSFGLNKAVNVKGTVLDAILARFSHMFRKNKSKIIVNADAAHEIVSSIGAMILEAKGE